MKIIVRSLLIFLSFVALSSCHLTKKLADSDNIPSSTFTDEQAKLIASADSTQILRVFKINNYQDSLLLREKSEEIDFIDGDPFLRAFAQRLLATVKDSASMGVGIAAPQVGVLKQMIWVQRFDKPEFPFECFLNPKIISYSEEKIPCPEGCLSIPDKQAMTKIRAKIIELEYDKLDGTHHKETVEGFSSVVFQHEIDHLHGILFIDHLENEK